MRPDILTVSGKYINFVETADNVVLVTDIAHALSQVCRFAGHTREFYSVAQHSVLVSQIVAPEFALQALFHDATEAYIGDVTRPLKALLPAYRAIEARLQDDIFAKLGLPPKIPSEIKQADLVLLATEQRDLMPWHGDEWACIAQISPLPDRIVPWESRLAMGMFLDRYRELTQPEMSSLIGTDIPAELGETAFGCGFGGRWIDVNEALPDADTTVLIVAPSCTEPVWLGFYNGELWMSVEGIVIEVTHWAELPIAPGYLPGGTA